MPPPDTRPPVEVGFDEIIKQTENGILVQLADTGEEKWLPKVVITNLKEVLEDPNRCDTLLVKRWFADREGLGPEE